VLGTDELRAFWACCCHPEGTGISPWHGGALKILLLLGQRREEIAQLRFEEIEGDDLVLPPSRTKNRRQHVLPLPKAAMAILESVPRLAGSEFVFSSDGVRPIGDWAAVKRRLDAAMAARLGLGKGSVDITLPAERMKPWRLHDLRRTMATGMARLGVAIHITERALNHASGQISGIAAVYNRYDFRSEVLSALERWAAEVTRIVGHETRPTGAASEVEVD
jgi:integrase